MKIRITNKNLNFDIHLELQRRCFKMLLSNGSWFYAFIDYNDKKCINTRSKRTSYGFLWVLITFVVPFFIKYQVFYVALKQILLNFWIYRVLKKIQNAIWCITKIVGNERLQPLDIFQFVDSLIEGHTGKYRSYYELHCVIELSYSRDPEDSYWDIEGVNQEY